MDERRQWHRLFGMSWTDFFTGLPVAVEMEKDLSLKQQLLDVVLIRKGPEPLPVRLPDGFEELTAYNLVSFKSHKEALDGWALNELVGHYVNLRKQVSPSFDDLLPETDFRLFAVCVRSPHNLAQRVELRPVGQGVYEARHFGGALRVVVVHELAQVEHNALLHLFSARAEQVRFGADRYQIRSGQTSTFLHQLFQRYQSEEVAMTFTKEQFLREAHEQILNNLSAEERQRFLQNLSAEERQHFLQSLPVEKRLEGVPVDELIKGLPPETLEELRRRLQADDSSRS